VIDVAVSVAAAAASLDADVGLDDWVIKYDDDDDDDVVDFGDWPTAATSNASGVVMETTTRPVRSLGFRIQRLTP
jgi:hypothetical protein